MGSVVAVCCGSARALLLSSPAIRKAATKDSFSPRRHSAAHTTTEVITCLPWAQLPVRSTCRQLALRVLVHAGESGAVHFAQTPRTRPARTSLTLPATPLRMHSTMLGSRW